MARNSPFEAIDLAQQPFAPGALGLHLAIGPLILRLARLSGGHGGQVGAARIDFLCHAFEFGLSRLHALIAQNHGDTLLTGCPLLTGGTQLPHDSRQFLDALQTVVRQQAAELVLCRLDPIGAAGKFVGIEP